MGKGSVRRHCQVSREEYESNYNRIFGAKMETQQKSDVDLKLKALIGTWMGLDAMERSNKLDELVSQIKELMQTAKS